MEAFDIEEYNHFVKLTKDTHKDIDLHMIEFIVGSYLFYDKMKIEKPDENSPDFIKQNEIIKKLIQNTKKIEQELFENNKIINKEIEDNQQE